VAGGLAPLEDCYRPDLVPPQEACVAEHREQAAMLAGAGVDLLFVETMNTIREAEAALAAAAATGLPVLLRLCPRRAHHLLSGEPLEAAVPRLIETGGAALRGVLLNCATPEVLEEAFPRFLGLGPGTPRGLYAHLGEPDEVTGWRLPESHDPARYTAW